MKAKEYYAKYKEQIMDISKEASDAAIKKMFLEMHDEANSLITSRHIKFDRAFWGVIDEINGRWNAVARMFEKEYGITPLRENGYKRFVKSALIEAKKKKDGTENTEEATPVS